jgi:hypothetical protein
MGGSGNGNVNVDGSLQAGFQGYGSSADDIHLSQMGRFYNAMAYAFSVPITNISAAHDVGTVYVELNGILGGASEGALMTNVYGEANNNMLYFFKFDQAIGNTIINPYAADPGSQFLSNVFLGTNSTHNTFLGPADQAAGKSYCTDDGNGECASSGMYH